MVFALIGIHSEIIKNPHLIEIMWCRTLMAELFELAELKSAQDVNIKTVKHFGVHLFCRGLSCYIPASSV